MLSRAENDVAVKLRRGVVSFSFGFGWGPKKRTFVFCKRREIRLKAEASQMLRLLSVELIPFKNNPKQPENLYGGNNKTLGLFRFSIYIYIYS